MYKQVGSVSRETCNQLFDLCQTLEWKVNKGPEVDYKTIQGFEDKLPELPWPKDKIKSAMFICIPAGGNIKRHSDNSPCKDEIGSWKTYHIPLTTNDHCTNLVYTGNQAQEFHLPVGTLWEFDTWPEHESFNLGKTNRIHLVINVYE